MKQLFPILVAAVAVAAASAAFAQWTPLAPDPGLWPYADGPTVETVTLPHLTYRLGSAVGVYDGNVAIFSCGGRGAVTYSRDAAGTDPKYWDNRQSKFSIYTPGIGWVGADGTDDTNNGDGTWTSVGLTGYNNGNGTNSPIVGNGTGYVGDQAFYYDGGFYVFGGYPQWGDVMAKYTVATNSWSAVALGDNDGLYMDGGGLVGSTWYKVHKTDYLMAYDCSTDTWGPDVNIVGLTDPQFGAAGVGIGSNLYVVDTDAAATPGALYIIDPVAGTVTNGAATPLPVREGVAVEYNGKLLLVGGRSGATNDTAVHYIQIYDPVSNTWTNSAVTLPSARSGLLAEVIGDTLYVGNGFNASADTPGLIDDFWSIGMNEVVPEPGTFMLIGSGLLGLWFFRRKK